MTAPIHWLSTSEMAALLKISQRAINKRIKAWGWCDPAKRCTVSNPQGIWRPRKGAGGGHEYHYSLLPARLQAVWQARMSGPVVDPTVTVKARKEAISREAAWEHYAKLPESKKAGAQQRLEIINLVEALVGGGTGKDDACRIVARQKGVSRASIFGWYDRLVGVTRADWLPFLIDHRGGARRVAEIPDEAWTLYKSLYLRAERPSHAECYLRVRDWAKGAGVTLPSGKAFVRRLEREVDTRTVTLTRQGMDAYLRMLPAQERSRDCFHALQALNYDGHTLDVFVQWPGADKPSRATLILFQDLYSTAALSWRLDASENGHVFRLAFGDVCEKYGLPDTVYSDNTMAAANKFNTGQSRHRHRYTPREDDPVGLFALLGVDLRFTLPAHGQSKPIERAFGTLSRYISKSPELAGAWTGNSPVNKPDNYGSKAVPLETLVAVVGREIDRFNNEAALFRAGNGKSRMEVFAASYAEAPIRKAAGLTLEQRLMWRLATDAVTCRKPDGAVYLYDNRYWNERLLPLIGQRVVLRYDPDNLHDGVHVYRLDGAYVCHAAAEGVAGYSSESAGKERARRVSTWRKAGRKLEEAEQLLSPAAVAAAIPDPTDAAPDLVAKVVRPMRFHGSAAVALDLVPAPQTDPDQFHAAFSKGVAALRLVTDE